MSCFTAAPTTHVRLTRENLPSALLASGSIPLLMEGVRIPDARVLPGRFDKSLRWRRADGANFRRALLVAPSDAFVASIPGGKIPDRRDFYTLSETERNRRVAAAPFASKRFALHATRCHCTSRAVT